MKPVLIISLLLCGLPSMGQDVPLNLTSGLRQYNQGAAWSPDGSQIAFMSREESNAAIYIVQADGSRLTQLTNGAGFDLNPAWSPDGTCIAFSSRRAGGESRIYTMAPDGSQIREISTSLEGGRHSTPSWSPDGSQLAFVAVTSNGIDIYVADLQSGQLRQITTDPAIDDQPFWSPDGTLGFISKREGGRGDLFRMLPSGEPENLTNHPARDVLWFFTSAGTNPWSPDGRWILFSSDRDSAIESSDVYMLSVADGTVRRLTFSRLTEFRFSWAPDSRRIAYDYSNQGRDDLFVLDIDSGVVTRVTDEGDAGTRPVWSPDGTQLAYLCPRTVGSDICTVSAARSIETAVTTPSLQTLDGDVSINSASDLEEFRERGGTAFKLFGSLTIRNTELADLTALSALEEIEGGNLRIQGNSSLVSLRGLEKISQIDELLIISNNALQSLEGLTNLQQVTFNTQITGNRTMQSLHGLDSLQRSGRLVISSNAELTDLQGLEKLRIVGGWPTYAYENLIIRHNASLRDLRGLESLTHVDGILQISSNATLETLTGLEQLEYLQLTLQIEKNPKLTNLDGLSNLHQFPGLATLGYDRGSLIIAENSSLTSVQGLAGLSDINTTLTIEDNILLESLLGLGGIASADLAISGNDALTSLLGLGLTRIGPSVISRNTSLESLIGLDSVVTARGLTIERNPALTNLDGLGQLQDVRQDLTIRNNEALRDPDSLTSLTEVGGTLLIRDNDALDEASVERLLQQMGRATAPIDDVSDSSATGGDTSRLPTRTQLLPAFPNPSNSSMTVAYDLAAGTTVRLQLYALSGQRVRHLVSGEQPAGHHIVTWDGRSDEGDPVAAGVYLIRFRAGHTLHTGKLMLLR